MKTTYSEKIWKSSVGNIKISNMSESHIQKCIDLLSSKAKTTYFGRAQWCYDWIDIFETELEEREAERNRIKIELGSSKSNIGINIRLTRMPSNCGECPFYLQNESYDDEAWFGDGITHSCPFGCSTWGCLVERPEDCILTEIKE